MSDLEYIDHNPVLVGKYAINLKNPISTYRTFKLGDSLLNLFLQEADFMKYELENAKKTKGIKIDQDDEHDPDSSSKLISSESSNPKWFRDFRHSYGYERDLIVKINKDGEEYEVKIKERMKNRKKGKVQYYRCSSVDKRNTLRSLERLINLKDYKHPNSRFTVVPYDYEMREIIMDRLTFEGYDEENCCEIFPSVIITAPDTEGEFDDIPF